MIRNAKPLIYQTAASPKHSNTRSSDFGKWTFQWNVFLFRYRADYFSSWIHSCFRQTPKVWRFYFLSSLSTSCHMEMETPHYTQLCSESDSQPKQSTSPAGKKSSPYQGARSQEQSVISARPTAGVCELLVWLSITSLDSVLLLGGECFYIKQIFITRNIKQARSRIPNPAQLCY